MRKRTTWLSVLVYVVVFIVLEMAAFQLISANAPLQRTWAAKGAHVFMAKVGGKSTAISQYFTLKSENEALVRENDALMQELLQAREQLRRAHSPTSVVVRTSWIRVKSRLSS